jgi:hypothetical protein
MDSILPLKASMHLKKKTAASGRIGSVLWRTQCGVTFNDAYKHEELEHRFKIHI